MNHNSPRSDWLFPIEDAPVFDAVNGVIFEQEAATLTVPHTRQGIHSLKVARPFAVTPHFLLLGYQIFSFSYSVLAP